MESPVWTEELATGLSDVDADHKILFGIINRLEEVRGMKDNHEDMMEILVNLAEYSQYHFRLEETLMKKSPQYKDSPMHLREHALFVKQVNDFIRDFSAGRELTDDVAAFLYGWWGNHIKGIDKAFVATII